MKVQTQASDDMGRLAGYFEGRRTAMLSFSDEHGQITARARPWFPGGADDADLVLLALQPHLADIWNGPDSDVMRLLALTASLLAARPIGLGEHQIIKSTAAGHH